MATQLTPMNTFCCSGRRKNKILSLSSLPVTSASSSSKRWRSVALNIRSTKRSVKLGQASRRKVQIFARRERVGGRPTKPARSGDGTSTRDRSSFVQHQKQEFQAKKPKQEEEEEGALTERALEALFAQLEKDLKDRAMSKEGDYDDEDFTVKGMMALEDELEAALLGPDYTQQNTTARRSERGASARKTQEDVEILLDGEEEDEEEHRVVRLEKWQLKKLAAATEISRCHVNVEALATELGMKRSDVLAWLKDPPPELLVLAASMGLEEESKGAHQVEEDFEVVGGRHSSKDSSSSSKLNPATRDLASVKWHSQKRLPKEHIATFERIFLRTRRPTNTMIQDLVELTHVPRKRIAEWFYQKRQEVEPSRSFESLR